MDHHHEHDRVHDAREPGEDVDTRHPADVAREEVKERPYIASAYRRRLSGIQAGASSMGAHGSMRSDKI